MPTEDDVRDCLRAIYDPDMPANIVDLGLLYSVEVDSNTVSIRMTLTRPGSPESTAVVQEVEDQIRSSFPEVEDIEVDVVWEPGWHPDRMSEDARATLGL